jgi:hypothetical protein
LLSHWRDDVGVRVGESACRGGVEDIVRIRITLDDYPVAVNFTENPGIVIVSVGIGAFVVEAPTFEEAVVQLADELQDQAIDIGLKAVPRCVGAHFHPARAQVVDNTAVWVCPASGETIRQIGSGTAG